MAIQGSGLLMSWTMHDPNRDTNNMHRYQEFRDHRLASSRSGSLTRLRLQGPTTVTFRYTRAALRMPRLIQLPKAWNV